MLLLYIAVLAFIKNQWSTGCFLFSCALSVKMNILLFLPGLLVLLVKRFGFFGMFPKFFIIVGFQVLVGIPFGLVSWKNYISRAFSFSRKFLFKWTVNYRFLSEDVFLSDHFGRMLLLGMLFTLCLYGAWKWTE
jgi:alpha-1,3-mannosyltransferase